MLFNSFIFIFIFLPITWLVFWMLKGKQNRYTWLSFSSYIFYGYWDWRFTILMMFSTVVDFTIAKWIDATDNQTKRKLLIMMTISINLLLLGFFKYYTFAAESVSSLLHIFSLNSPLPTFSIILPVGISFYTFQTMSYTIDVYRRKLKATHNFMEFNCFVSLFPQLVAGPIVRFSDIVDDLNNIDSTNTQQQFPRGLSLFILGLSKKMIIADTIAFFINPLFLDVNSLSSLTAWIAIIGYTLQLYFDFSGYSDMAIGLGLMFGFHFPANFNSPYKAVDIQDFWRRWHISLSTWLKDYLYIPLGGSRGSEIRTSINMMITMLLGGLWHGANWNFVVWGGYQGLLLGITKQTKSHYDTLPYFLRRIITLLLVIIGWVFFRTLTLHESGLMLSKMFSFNNLHIPSTWTDESLVILYSALAIGTYIALFSKNTNEIEHTTSKKRALLLALLFVVCLLLMNYGQQAFLYYQF